jgi:hypothetical protein
MPWFARVLILLGAAIGFFYFMVQHFETDTDLSLVLVVVFLMIFIFSGPRVIFRRRKK